MIRICNCLLFLLLPGFSCPDLLAQNPGKAIDSLLAVIRLAQEDTNKVKSLNALHWRLRNISDYVRAEKYADSALLLADRLNYKQGKSSALNTLGVINMDKGNYPVALKYYNMSLKICEETGNKRGVAGCLGNIGIIHMGLGNYPEALKYQKAALKIHEENNHKQGAAACYNNIGSIYKSQGNYPEALKNQFACLRLAEETGNNGFAAVAYGDISEIHVIQGNLPEALKNLSYALKIQMELGDKRSIAGLYNSIGNLYYKLDNNPEAIKNHLAAINIGKEIGNKRDIAIAYGRLGNIYHKQDKYDEAMEKYRLSLSLFEELGDKDWIARIYVDMGKALTNQATGKPATDASLKHAEAIRFLNKGLNLAKETGTIETVKEALGGLAVTYRSMNELEKALAFYNRYVEMKDSLINNETSRKLEQLRIQYEVERAVAEEKTQQERIIAEQYARHQLAIAQEQVKKEKAIEIEKLKYAFALSEEKTNEENKLAAENARHQRSLSDEKARQQVKDAEAKSLLEKEKSEKERRTEVYMAGIMGLALLSVFIILLIRQRNEKRIAVEKAEAGHRMAELELQSLRAQLNPHFMFNSLNAIQDLILKEDNDRSHLYLSRFSKLLRMLLDNADRPFVPVKQEMELLELYLSLENLRIPDLRFFIEKDQHINTEDRMVPNMMLQPYIENAIWHGLSNKKGNKDLRIRIYEDKNATNFEIEDNGIGRKKAAELKSLYRKGYTSKGMELLSKRFSLLSKEYGTAIETSITDLTNNGDATGTLVKIKVPFTLSEQGKQLVHDTNRNNR